MKRLYFSYFKKSIPLLLLIFLFLEIGLRLEGLAYSFLQERENRISLRQKDVYRILCLGDSVTAGMQAEKYSYPRQLEQILNQRNIGVKFSVVNKGARAAHTLTILEGLEENLNKYNPDMVITMMGALDTKIPVKRKNRFFEEMVIFLESFRTYQLGKLVHHHVSDRITKKGIHTPKKHTKSGISFMDRTEYPQASGKDEAELLNNIKIDPKNLPFYLKLGQDYIAKERFKEARRILYKVIEVEPANYLAYYRLGLCYQNEGRPQQARRMYQKCIELNPEHSWAYSSSAWCCMDEDKFDEAYEMFQKSLELNPQDAGAYLGLSQYYQEKKNPKEAAKILRKLLEIRPDDKDAHLWLGWCYQAEGKLILARESFQRAMETNPEDIRAYGSILSCCEQEKEYELAQMYLRKANVIGQDAFRNPLTRDNYQKLNKILVKRRIRLVCVQYPLYSVQLIKRMFIVGDGIIFVDNENLFKKAIRQGEYFKYFEEDIVGSGAAHCTIDGNRLLAENVADVILRSCFGEK